MFSVNAIRRLIAGGILLMALFLLPSLFVRAVVRDESPLYEHVDAFDQTKLSSNAFTQEDDTRIIGNHLDIPETFLLASSSEGYGLSGN